jgi:hypothetical protein
MECCETRMRCVTTGQAVIVGDQVFSADRYRCETCGQYRFGTPGQAPIRPLSEWGADWIMQPAQWSETPEQAEASMADLEARKQAAGF